MDMHQVLEGNLQDTGWKVQRIKGTTAHLVHSETKAKNKVFWVGKAWAFIDGTTLEEAFK